ncbi:hypothetical protein MTO96_050072, partial [Rhipicephalus appendiculatus]
WPWITSRPKEFRSRLWPRGGATLVARLAVTPGQDQEVLEVEVHHEEKPEEVKYWVEPNESGVDSNRASKEAGGDADDYKVNATEVSTIGDTEGESCETEVMLYLCTPPTTMTRSRAPRRSVRPVRRK